MKIKILKEEGYSEALFGMGLSHGLTSDLEYSDFVENTQLVNRLHAVAPCLAPKGFGHSKFLESINVHIDITATMKFWDQFDTYRVGMTKQSTSTMHRKNDAHLHIEDCAHGVDHRIVDIVNEYIDKGEKTQAILNFPFGFLYRRIVCTNYKTLRNIILQRWNHIWFEWPMFVAAVIDQVEHPELLPKVKHEN
jgi:hypothetical protein